MSTTFDAKLLDQVHPVPLGKGLYRGVKFHTLLSKTPPEPLFVSAAPNRFNRRGVRTLYFGETFVTAYAETVQSRAGLLTEHSPAERRTAGGSYALGEEGEEPVVLFMTEAWVERLIDLTDPATLAKLGIPQESLIGNWRWEESMGIDPWTQQIGDAIYRSNRFEGVRYSSEKAHDPTRPVPHANWAVFVDRLAGDSFLDVKDVSGTLKGHLPATGS